MNEERTVWLIERVNTVWGLDATFIDIADTYEQGLLIVRYDIENEDGIASEPYTESHTGHRRVDNKSMAIYYLLREVETNRMLQEAMQFFEDRVRELGDSDE